MSKLACKPCFYLAFLFFICCSLSSFKVSNSMNKEAVLSHTSSDFSPKDVEQFVFLYQFVNFDTQTMGVWSEKAKKDELREFAQKQLKISSSQKALLENVASENDIKLPAALSQAYEREIYKYSTSGGEDYDKVFMNNYLEMCKIFQDSLNQIIEMSDVNPEVKHLSKNSYNTMKSRVIQVDKLRKETWDN